MGNTTCARNCQTIWPVHPHTHGEHDAHIAVFTASTGSSPHAWGTPREYLSPCRSHRFIPTRMGNTLMWLRADNTGTVHPHTHGEHRASISAWVQYAGSSPHAWGTRVWGRCRGRGYRFIPTRMGNTRGLTWPRLHLPVHPHTHGEHS